MYINNNFDLIFVKASQEKDTLVYELGNGDIETRYHPKADLVPIGWSRLYKDGRVQRVETSEISRVPIQIQEDGGIEFLKTPPKDMRCWRPIDTLDKKKKNKAGDPMYAFFTDNILFDICAIKNLQPELMYVPSPEVQ